MKNFSCELNNLIVDVYRSIMRVEEKTLQNSDKMDLSINEMHMIESVGKGRGKSTISQLAEDIGITLPSVTVAINKLSKKGYVEKVRGEEDGRIVYVSLTKQGKKIELAHKYFHESMVRSIIEELNQEEQQALYKGVSKLDDFLKTRL